MDLAQRIDAPEQITALEQLKYRYWRACDAEDPKTSRECFIRSGEYNEYRIEDGFWRMPTGHYTPTWSITRLLAADAMVTEGVVAEVAR
ncbi:hypothetical protein AB0H60_33290 [Nocardia rhamnosiphila]|uniref:hypothetical protein n=1 Tax=Nocardia rhamnosiphila TaxID=426716 RepID=UPI0033F15BDF